MNVSSRPSFRPKDGWPKAVSPLRGIAHQTCVLYARPRWSDRMRVMTQTNYLHSSFGLDGKRALVTGASRGIGRAVAMALASAGAQVLIHYHRNETAAREV